MKILMALIFSLGTGSFFAFAGDGETSEQDMKYHDIAKKRYFAGGKDEGHLKVDTEDHVPVQKVNRRQIEKEVYQQLFEKDQSGDSSSSGETKN